MNVIEIDASNRVIRIQEVPDTWVVKGGSISSDTGHIVFPDTSRWYPAPTNVREGDVFDVPTGTATPPTIDLDKYKSALIADVRDQAQTHILAIWPIWRQVNAEAGIYPPEVKEQKDADIAATILESNRVEDIIDAAPTVSSADIAASTLTLPTFPV